MKDIPQFISHAVKEQFPAIFREDKDNLVSFIEAYYEFLEESDEYSLKMNRQMFDIGDVDTTLDQFVKSFKKKYLDGMPYVATTDTNFIIKHIMDVYRSKGTEKSVKLLMKLLFNEEVSVYYPAIDILKPSDSKWILPKYLEVTYSDGLYDMVGKTITGSVSGATAFVESIVKRRISGKYIYVVFVDDVIGTFVPDDRISTTNSFTNTSKVIGSLISLRIITKGSGYEVGDLVNVISVNGKDAIGRVTSIRNSGTEIEFEIVDGGFGFTLDAYTEVHISDTVLSVVGPTYDIYENVYQNMELLTTSVDANVSLGDGVVGSNGTANVSSGVVLSSLSNTEIVVQITSGTFNDANTIYVDATEYTLSSVADRSANGYVVGQNDVSVGIKTSGASNTFLTTSNNGILESSSSANSTIIRVAFGSGASFEIGELSNTENINVNTDIVGSNNDFGNPYTSLQIDAVAYGFPANNSANSSSTIGDALSTANLTIGEISSLKSINPGINYDASIFVQIDNSIISGANRQHLRLSLDSVSGTYQVDELVTATGGKKGKVVSYGDYLVVRPLSYENEFELGDVVVGSSSTASGNIIFIDEISSDPMGRNADITGEVSISEGAIETVSVKEAGFGFIEGETVTLTSDDVSKTDATATTQLCGLGTGRGYWTTTNSHLSGDKKIRDNDYYQEYSYEIQSAIALDKYRDIIKDTVHVSGNKLFGLMDKKSEVDVIVTNNTLVDIEVLYDPDLNFLFEDNEIGVWYDVSDNTNMSTET